MGGAGRRGVDRGLPWEGEPVDLAGAELAARRAWRCSCRHRAAPVGVARPRCPGPTRRRRRRCPPTPPQCDAWRPSSPTRRPRFAGSQPSSTTHGRAATGAQSPSETQLDHQAVLAERDEAARAAAAAMQERDEALDARATANWERDTAVAERDAGERAPLARRAEGRPAHVGAGAVGTALCCSGRAHGVGAVVSTLLHNVV
jgi:hypothetical protein